VDYSYDQIGQLIEDDAEFISHIEWNTQNKIKRVVRAHPDLIADPSGNVYRSDLEFVYDPLGNRVAKIEKPRDGDGDVKSQLFWIYTLYARDATGNTLATYSRSFETPQGDYPIDHLAVQAHEIYGSKRLGTSRLGLHMQREFEINSMTTASYHAGDQQYLTEDIFDDVTYFTNQVSAPSHQFTHVLGQKQYELSNHLGNVLATISDAKTPQGASGNGQALGYAARIVNLQDYYPFGMLQPGRQFSEEGYNYGFQAQEIDDEYLAGAVSFKYRIHDARIGRFLSVDPLAAKFVWNSPYTFSENRILDRIELEGLEAWPVSPSAGPVTRFDYQQYVQRKSVELTTDVKMKNDFQDCADACMLIPVMYHRDRGLDFSMTMNNKTVNSSDPKYSGEGAFDAFMLDVRAMVSSYGFTVSEDMVLIRSAEAEPGDLMVGNGHANTYLSTSIGAVEPINAMNASGLFFSPGNPNNEPGTGPYLETYPNFWAPVYRFKFLEDAPHDVDLEPVEPIKIGAIITPEIEKNLHNPSNP
jgi:RHS repeat-associated protein